MRRDLSTYLDLLRFGAAVTVFVSHLRWSILTGDFLWQLEFLGHDAVMVFFVLSGFVIQYVVDTKEKTFIDYQMARLARLYSVAIPALILTYIFDRIGIAHHPASYVASLDNNAFLRLAAGVTFLAQSWYWDLAALSNNPFWSLCYEFWYYQIFAAAIFFKGSRRIILIAICCVIAGPRILSYFPLWLAGVGAYRLSQVTKLGRHASLVFIMSLLAALVILWADHKGMFSRVDTGPRGQEPIDYVLAFLIALNIYAATFLRLPLTAMTKPIATCASITFALYLLHLPIFHLLAAFTPTTIPTLYRGLILIAGAVPIIVALSFVTERRKKEWRAFFRWLLVGHGKKLVTAPE